ncbi:MAG: lysine--tRNA ligase [Candidatus Hydrogenedentes bacterium]|nr:lysine--tRNA ligase [Candidatus Hydrogenedentota bacterium]
MHQEHHSSEQDLIQNRLQKLSHIRSRGDEPFKHKFERSSLIGEARAAFEAAEKEAADPQEIHVEAVLAGRMTSFRSHGKSAFADLRDEGAKIQLYFKKDALSDGAFEALHDLDLGDFVGASGNVFRTRTGEITLHVRSYELLTKSLRPLPEKYHGLSDVETRYRQRYLDLVANPEVKEKFGRRIAMISAMREHLTARGFAEVETPMLHPIPGGATARPFVTHHHSLDQDMYLRIAPELYLKRLLVGGFEKVFEINRNFRNEGLDSTHNPEFTMLELYEAYQDYLGLMDDTEELFVSVIQQVLGATTLTYQGETIEAKRPWKRVKLFDAIREHAGIDLEAVPERDTAARLATSIGVEIDETLGYGKIVDTVMSDRVVPYLVHPTFLYDYPVELSPLAKKKRGSPALVERFQVFVGRLELCNAFSELNDPVDQRERFQEQARQREQGDEEAQYLDEDYLTALEVGMPPAAGLGIGIDRLAMLLTDSASIREVIFFPQLRNL